MVENEKRMIDDELTRQNQEHEAKTATVMINKRQHQTDVLR